MLLTRIAFFEYLVLELSIVQPGRDNIKDTVQLVQTLIRKSFAELDFELVSAFIDHCFL